MSWLFKSGDAEGVEGDEDDKEAITHAVSGSIATHVNNTFWENCDLLQAPLTVLEIVDVEELFNGDLNHDFGN